MKKWSRYAAMLVIALVGWWVLAACQAAPRSTGTILSHSDQQIGLIVGRDTYLYDASTETLTELTRGENVEWAVWSPNGETLALETDDDNGPDLYALDVATGEITRLFNSTPQSSFHQNYSDQYIDWSPDSRSLIYDVGTGTGADLYLIKIETGELTNLTGGQYPYSWQYAVSWSPDGRRVLYQTGQAGDPGRPTEIYSLEIDTQAIRLLGNGRQPVWSPDGEKIAYLVSPPDAAAQAEIYVMQADGSDSQRVVDRKGDYGGPPVWSPDGKFIAFVENIRDDEDQAISRNVYVTDFDKTWLVGEMTTQRTGFREPFPQWSPDSMRLAFETDSAFCWYDLQGGEALCQFDDVTSDPLLASDGQRVAYLSISDGSTHYALCVGSSKEDQRCSDELDVYAGYVVMLGWRP